MQNQRLGMLFLCYVLSALKYQNSTNCHRLNVLRIWCLIETKLHTRQYFINVPFNLFLAVLMPL